MDEPSDEMIMEFFGLTEADVRHLEDWFRGDEDDSRPPRG